MPAISSSSTFIMLFVFSLLLKVGCKSGLIDRTLKLFFCKLRFQIRNSSRSTVVGHLGFQNSIQFTQLIFYTGLTTSAGHALNIKDDMFYICLRNILYLSGLRIREKPMRVVWKSQQQRRHNGYYAKKRFRLGETGFFRITFTVDLI